MSLINELMQTYNVWCRIILLIHSEFDSNPFSSISDTPLDNLVRRPVWPNSFSIRQHTFPQFTITSLVKSSTPYFLIFIRFESENSRTTLLVVSYSRQKPCSQDRAVNLWNTDPMAGRVWGNSGFETGEDGERSSWRLINSDFDISRDRVFLILKHGPDAAFSPAGPGYMG